MDIDAIISLQKHTIDGLRAELARVTAEREEARAGRRELERFRDRYEPVRQSLIKQEAELAALRARVYELVEQLKAYGKYAHDTTQEDINSELVAALERVRDTPGSDQTAPYRLREIARDALARAESAACQKATNPSQISSEPATPGLRTDNPMAEPVMGGLPRHEGEKLGTPAKQPPTT